MLGYDRPVIALRAPETVDAAVFDKALRDTGIGPINLANQQPGAHLSSVDVEVRERAATGCGQP